MKALWLNLEASRAGSGERLFAVVRIGRKDALLLATATLTSVRVTIAQLKAGRDAGLKDAKLRRIIDAKRRERKRLGLAWSESATKAALAALTPKEKS